MTKQFRTGAMVTIWAALWVLGLAACGGGGDSSTVTTPPSTPSAPLPIVLTLNGQTVVSGVVASGAPMLGANIRVIDAKGNAITLLNAGGKSVNSLRSSTADGSFRLIFAADKTPLPLLIQAAGIDGAGTPVVLHTALIGNTAPLIAQITPITEALVGLMLGASPRSVFDQPTLASRNLPLLANATALASASDLLKSVLATNMADTKVTNAKTLDLLADSSFLANRLLVDAVLDGTRMQMAQDAGGRDVVQISNKFALPGVVEVSVSLANARAELLLGSTGAINKAITSTLKVATSPHKASLVNLATIDALTARINNQIAQNAGNASFTTTLLSAYTKQDGRGKTAMADLLAGYANSNLQLGRWSLLGCVDDPIPTKGCTKFQAAALVIDGAIDGADAVVGILNDTLGNDAAKPAQWTLLGNDRSSSLRVQQVAQLRLNLDGSVRTGEFAANGLQLIAPAFDGTTPLLTSATVQVPSGYSVRLVGCNTSALCVFPTGSNVPVTGELSDTLLQQTPGWIGSQDAAMGASYAATNSLPNGTTELFKTYLRSTVATDLRASLFPKPDVPLNVATLNTGFKLEWKAWAEINPGMQMKSVRLISNNPAAIRDIALSGPMVTEVMIPAPSAAITSFQLWLGAQDTQGRMFYSQFKSDL